MLVSRRVCVNQGAIQGITEKIGLVRGWSRLSQRVNQVDQHTKRKRCTERDQVIPWYGKHVHCALCTNPWSMWEFYVGLGTCSWACVKRKISLNPWRGWHQVVIVIKIAVCKFKCIIAKRSSAWSLPSIVVTMDLWRCAEEWLTHSGLWGSNHLVFIEPTQSRKVVQLDRFDLDRFSTLHQANIYSSSRKHLVFIEETSSLDIVKIVII